jgi:lipopolysaccharide/colanic/teichoic acid biosynthesis glycosyltransferase
LDFEGSGVFFFPLPTAPAVCSTVKRAGDVVLASILLVLALPVLLLAAALIRLSSSGPVFFLQQRVGFRCETFAMYKLRTMVAGAEQQAEELAEQCAGPIFFKLPEDPRITPVGRVLRKLSIDELPQLLNVVRGEMSLVGPRPLLLSDFEKFPKREQLRRFSAKPGLTGLWQVNGRSACSDEERLRLDLEYVDGWSLGGDLWIVLRTVPTVLSGRGAS